MLLNTHGTEPTNHRHQENGEMQLLWFLSKTHFQVICSNFIWKKTVPSVPLIHAHVRNTMRVKSLVPATGKQPIPGSSSSLILWCHNGKAKFALLNRLLTYIPCIWEIPILLPWIKWWHRCRCWEMPTIWPTNHSTASILTVLNVTNFRQSGRLTKQSWWNKARKTLEI